MKPRTMEAKKKQASQNTTDFKNSLLDGHN